MEYVQTYTPSQDELASAETAIRTVWGPEVEAKLDPLLEYSVVGLVTPEQETAPQGKLRVIVRYQRRDGFESLIESYEADLANRGGEAAEVPLTGAMNRLEFIENVARAQAAPLLTGIRQQGGTVQEHLELAEAIVAELTPEQIRSLAARPDVVRLEADRMMSLELVQSTRTIGLTIARQQGLAGRGKGIIVAVLDGEVDASHPDLRGRVVSKRDYTGEGFGAATSNAMTAIHGTHVAGIVAGDGPTYQGIAPEATIWNYKIYAADQSQSPEGFKGAQAIEDAIKDGAHVINCSWGVSDTPRDGTCVWCKVAERAARLGVVLVKSAGNNGPDRGTTTCPANARGDVIVVGGSLRNGTGVMTRSSRGPTADGRPKPDVLAPGELITSAVPGGYRRLSGTSMASPHVAGLAALMLEKNPRLKPADIKRILMESARRIDEVGQEDVIIQGRGLIEVASVMRRVLAPSPPTISLPTTTVPTTTVPSVTEPEQRSPIEPAVTLKGSKCVTQMEVALRNTGAQLLQDVRATLRPTSPDVRVAREEVVLGSLTAGGQAAAQFDIELPFGAVPAPQSFDLIVTDTSAGQTRTTRRTIRLEACPTPGAQPAPGTGAAPMTPPGGGVQPGSFR